MKNEDSEEFDEDLLHQLIESLNNIKNGKIRKIKEFNLKVDPYSPKVAQIVKDMKELENQGFQFEGAEASFELLIKKTFGLHRKFFDLIGFRVIIEKNPDEKKIIFTFIRLILPPMCQ